MGPAWLDPPAGARIRRKKRKIKNKGRGGICAPRAQRGRVPQKLAKIQRRERAIKINS